MSFFLSFGDYLQRQANNVEDYIQGVARETLEFACETWNDYPDIVTQNKLLPISVVRGFMTKACSPNNPPPPNSPPECEEKFYLFGTYISKNSSAGGCDVEAYWRSKVAIPVSELLSYTPTVQGGDIMGITGKSGDVYVIGRLNFGEYEQLSTTPMAGTNRIFFREETLTCLNITVPGYGHSFIQTEILQDGAIPDSCNDTVQYPVTTPPTIVSKDIITNFNEINQVYNVEIINNDNDSFSFPLTFNWGGQLNVTLDIGGFTFDSGGGNDDDVGGNGDSTETPKPVTPVPTPQVDITIKKPFVPSDYDEVNPSDDPETPEVEDEEVEQIAIQDAAVRWVLVDITTFPINGKAILQNNAENTDYFAGYFHWQIATPTGNYKMPGLPIRKQKNAFLAPIEAVGYSAYTVNGAKIKLTQYNQKDEG